MCLFSCCYDYCIFRVGHHGLYNILFSFLPFLIFVLVLAVVNITVLQIWSVESSECTLLMYIKTETHDVLFFASLIFSFVKIKAYQLLDAKILTATKLSSKGCQDKPLRLKSKLDTFFSLFG